MGQSAITHVHVQRMLDEIHRNYAGRLTLAALAKKLERQPTYAGRLFREQVGITVHEYITRARIIFGATQVRAGEKIEAVALELGYRSKKNFYRQFRRRFGVTPEMYRRGHTDIARPLRARVPSTPHRAGRAPSLLVRQGDQSAGGAIQTRGGLPPTWRSSFAQQFVRALLDRHVAIIATDQTGRCVAANLAAAHLTGYSVRELATLQIQSVFPDANDGTHAPRLHTIVAASSLLPANAALRTKSGGLTLVHMTHAENLIRTSTTDPAPRSTERRCLFGFRV
jgi:PAS domain S-box-containing protein